LVGMPNSAHTSWKWLMRIPEGACGRKVTLIALQVREVGEQAHELRLPPRARLREYRMHLRPHRSDGNPGCRCMFTGGLAHQQRGGEPTLGGG
jgi:hypothetical protein